jgi:hypothetical protein
LLRKKYIFTQIFSFPWAKAASWVKAMARKIAILYWRVMVKGIDYAEKGIKNYEEQLLVNKMKSWNRLTKELNMKAAINAQVT